MTQIWKEEIFKVVRFSMILFLIVSASFFFCYPTYAEKGGGLNVIVITFDTTRADHVGCYGYKGVKTPNIDRLAKDGCLFEQAFTPVPLTFPAHASIFTGLYPIAHGIQNNGNFALSNSATTLAEMLKQEGYKTAAFISAYVLDKRFGLDQGFDVYDDDLVTGIEPRLSQKERRAENVAQPALKWLERVRQNKFFLWVHFFDPHDAYQPPSPFSEEYSKNPYDGEIAYADHWLGKILDKLSALKLTDNTLIVLAGDHGEGLGEHSEKTHGIFLYDYALWIPLVISCPRILPRAKRVQSLARLIDISPTILEILAVNKPKDMQGTSLLPLMTGKKDDLGLVLFCETLYPKFSHNWSPLEGLRTEGWKYISAPIKELYDLNKDRKEMVNLFEKNKDRAGEMERIFDGIKAEITPKESVAAPIEMNAEAKAKIESLGYIWAPDTEAAREEKRIYPDPKKMVKILDLEAEGAELYGKSEFEKALPIFEKVLEINPEDTEAYVTLGHIYEALGKDEKAIESFQKALSLEPENLRIYIQLGVNFMKTKRYDEGIDAFRKALELNERCKEAYQNIGLYHFQNQQWTEAIENFKNVLTLDPGDLAASNYLSVGYIRTGDFDEAIAEASKVLEKDTNNAMAFLNLGSAYHSSQRFPEAQDALERAVKIQPDLSKAHYYLGLVFFQLDKVPDAIHAFRQAIKYDPESVEAHFNLGYIYYSKQQNIALAINEFQEALRINPNFFPARQILQRLQQK